MRRLHDDGRGLALLETALIMPILVVVILAAADVALFAYGYVGSAHAVAEGARCGVVGGTDAAVTTRVQDATSYATPLSITLSSRSDVAKGDDFTVMGTFRHEWVTPGIPTLNFTIYTQSSTQRMETDAVHRSDCPNAS